MFGHLKRLLEILGVFQCLVEFNGPLPVLRNARQTPGSPWHVTTPHDIKPAKYQVSPSRQLVGLPESPCKYNANMTWRYSRCSLLTKHLASAGDPAVEMCATFRTSCSSQWSSSRDVHYFQNTLLQPVIQQSRCALLSQHLAPVGDPAVEMCATYRTPCSSPWSSSRDVRYLQSILL